MHTHTSIYLHAHPHTHSAQCPRLKSYYKRALLKLHNIANYRYYYICGPHVHVHKTEEKKTQNKHK